MPLRDRVRGVLIGMAIADRDGVITRTALLLAESLLIRGRFDLDDFRQRHLDWVRRALAAAEPAPSPTPGLYAPILAMASFLKDDQLAGLTPAEVALEGRDVQTGDAAAATAVLCRALIRGREWPAAVQHASVGRLPRTRTALQAGITSSPDEGECGSELVETTALPLSAGRSIGEPQADHAALLQAAVDCVRRRRDFTQALGPGRAFGGATDQLPILAGALTGARWGALSLRLTALARGGIGNEVWQRADGLSKEWLTS